MIRVGISVKRYTILKMSHKILHNTNFPKIAKWVPEAKNYHATFQNQIWLPKAKNYHMTKKKGCATFQNHIWVPEAKNNRTTKKKGRATFQNQIWVPEAKNYRTT